MIVRLSKPHDEVEAVIIGAGVIGASIGYELARRGWTTLNVDAGPAAGYGSTSSSSAIVRFTYSTHDGVAMSWEGLHYWLNWAEHIGDVDERGLAQLVQCGMLLLKDASGHHHTVLPLFDRIGVPYEDLDTAGLAARMPELDLGAFGAATAVDDEAFGAEAIDQVEGAIWSPDAGYVDDPQLAAHNLQRAAEAQGGRFRFGTRVTSVDSHEGQVRGVTFEDGSGVAARVVVNAAGPHSARVNAMAGLEGTMRIVTQPLRHESHHVPVPEQLDFDHRGSVVADTASGVYFRPQAGNHILVGSTDPACDEREWVEDPDEFNRSVTEAQFTTQVMRLARRMPDVGVPNRRQGVADLYDVSDDWIPIYDRTDLDGFYVAIGTSGNQFKNAGVVGHCMAELITAVEAGHDHDAAPLRVTGRWTGLEMNLGTFARNREINPDSSFSVAG
ncbi:NAD(P)/FAD-dependent oxidoreductase [Euzebya tangerina]|uniref:NAD(P)/FAD-dependent oxidoreductase n=1 Tax=Euzebya tangerina TaxID=591198 RepID=UPI00196A933C|nr:FAD-dependent oxidoreductase [Euzebya tangerina]